MAKAGFIDPRPAFGMRLKELRIKKGLAQEELADIAGLDRTYISSCERGVRNISLINIYKLAHALGVKPAELMSPQGKQ